MRETVKQRQPMDHCPAPHSRGKLRKYGWAGGRLALAALIAALLLWFTGCMERMFYYPAAEDTPVPPELAQRGITSRALPQSFPR